MFRERMKNMPPETLEPSCVGSKPEDMLFRIML
jgi:hypothetical protein